MKALITGGSGYFGSLLVNNLIMKNWNCRVFDINSYIGSESVQFIRGDIRDLDAVMRACEGIDVVFHNVAQVPLAKNKELFNSVNKVGTKNILKACKKLGVKKIIYTSSSAVYGIPSTNPVNEKMIPKPMENYGQAKHDAEKLCQEFISNNLDVVIVRPRTILGHGRLGIFQILFEWIKNGNNIPVLGKGDNVYQFVHADDLAEAIILCANSNVKSSIFNIGSENFSTMRETLENLCNYAGTGSKVKSVPFKAAVFGMKISSALGISPLGSYHSLMYGRSMYFDINKSKNDLGWKPRFSSDDMFRESYDWYCDNRKKVLSNTNSKSHHQSKVKQGVLSIINKFL